MENQIYIYNFCIIHSGINLNKKEEAAMGKMTLLLKKLLLSMHKIQTTIFNFLLLSHRLFHETVNIDVRTYKKHNIA